MVIPRKASIEVILFPDNLLYIVKRGLWEIRN
jgi:hypothetical protein